MGLNPRDRFKSLTPSPVQPMRFDSGTNFGPERRKAMSKTHTVKIGRDAKTGEFIPVKEAIRRPSTTVVETIKVPTKSK